MKPSFELTPVQAQLLAVDEDQLALLVQLGYSVSEARSGFIFNELQTKIPN
jgi:hypothetical protein